MRIICCLSFISGCLWFSGCAEKGTSSESSANAENTDNTVAPTGDVERKTSALRPDPTPPHPAPEGMVWIPGGTFEMGCEIADGGEPDETPVHKVELDGFYIDKTEVTNAQFMEFVEATGYKTTAEQKPFLRSVKGQGPIDVSDSVKPGSLCMNPNLKRGQFNPATGAYSWAGYIEGANWRHPEGPDSSIKDRMDHPVVHVSWLDAKAYCDWAGKKLPTEAQWEYASRGGRAGKTYPWGDKRNPDGKWMQNIWQGEFPVENTADDGFRGTAPVASFPPNGYGLYDMSGNVWEWVADYYRHDYYANSPRKNPPGPKDSLDPREPNIIKRAQRGGSFMCADSYCISYRNSAREPGEEDTGTFHCGFRCVVTPEMLKDREEAQ